MKRQEGFLPILLLPKISQAALGHPCEVVSLHGRNRVVQYLWCTCVGSFWVILLYRELCGLGGAAISDQWGLAELGLTRLQRSNPPAHPQPSEVDALPVSTFHHMTVLLVTVETSGNAKRTETPSLVMCQKKKRVGWSVLDVTNWDQLGQSMP